MTDQLKINAVKRGLLTNERGVNAAFCHIADDDKPNQMIIPDIQYFHAGFGRHCDLLSVIAARRDEMQPEKPDRILRKRFWIRGRQPDHRASGSTALQIGVAHQRQDAAFVMQNILSLRAISRSVNILHAGFTVLVNQNPAVHRAACFACQLHIGTHARRHHQKIKRDFPSAFCHRAAGSDFRGSFSQHKINVPALDMLLHQLCARFI